MAESSLSKKYAKIAQLVVEQNLNIKKGEQVMIYTWGHTLEAVGELCFAIQKKGANPFVQLTIEDQYFRAFAELDLKVLKVKDKFGKAAAEVEDVIIFLSGPKDPTNFQKVPYEKMHAVWDQAERKEIEKIHEKRKVRFAFLNIGQATKERAKSYGIPFQPWHDGMLSALTTNPKTLAKAAKPLISALKMGKKATVTSHDGSVLELKLAGRAPVLDDGVLRPKDIVAGDTFVHLPSGVVFCAPLEWKAKGRISYDLPIASRAIWIRNPWIDVDKGQLKKFGAKVNQKEFKSSVGPIEGKKVGLGYITVGVNPAAKPFFLDNQMAPGVVGVHFGNNDTFGGKLKEGQHYVGGFSAKATLEVDGKAIVKKGKIRT
jgi:leucyl aminopeptidase (aminopeptidase T)